VAGRVGIPALSRPIAHCLAEALRFSIPFGGVPLATIPIAVSQTWLAETHAHSPVVRLKL
ncbi:MAG: hypothetical protein ACKOEH_03165, partial [Actinomycetota bacterium]